MRETMNQEKLLLIPGPTPVHLQILNALSQPTLSHVSPVFVVELKEALANLKKTLASIGYSGKLKSNGRTTESKFEAIRNKRVKE